MTRSLVALEPFDLGGQRYLPVPTRRRPSSRSRARRAETSSTFLSDPAARALHALPRATPRWTSRSKRASITTPPRCARGAAERVRRRRDGRSLSLGARRRGGALARTDPLPARLRRPLPGLWQGPERGASRARGEARRSSLGRPREPSRPPLTRLAADQSPAPSSYARSRSSWSHSGHRIIAAASSSRPTWETNSACLQRARAPRSAGSSEPHCEHSAPTRTSLTICEGCHEIAAPKHARPTGCGAGCATLGSRSWPSPRGRRRSLAATSGGHSTRIEAPRVNTCPTAGSRSSRIASARRARRTGDARSSRSARPPPRSVSRFGVAVDALGGDRAPDEIVAGALDAASPSIVPVLFGPADLDTGGLEHVVDRRDRRDAREAGRGGPRQAGVVARPGGSRCRATARPTWSSRPGTPAPCSPPRCSTSGAAGRPPARDRRRDPCAPWPDRADRRRRERRRSTRAPPPVRPHGLGLRRGDPRPGAPRRCGSSRSARRRRRETN